MILFSRKYRWLLHILFWMIYTIVHITSFVQVLSLEDSLIRYIPNLFLHAGFAYLNFYYLLPKFFLQKKYFYYFSASIFLLVVFSFFRMKLDEIFPPISAYITRKEEFLRLKFIIPLMVNLLIWVVSSLFRLLEDYFENVKRENELKKNRLESELKFLKTQINPHFLFNTLNNIYSLVYLKSDEAAPMLLKLSGILRYMIYESDNPKVPIQKEIDYLKDYIELQILNPADRPKVKFEVENHAPNLMIEPLLFINFLENSFKHGSLSKKDGFIDLNMKIEVNSVDFSLKNSVLPSNSPKDKVGGIGLQNIKQRLELVYPNRHILEIKADEKEYFVKLILKN